MDWTALVLVSTPLTGAALYIAFYLLKEMCHRQRPGYTQIVTPASSQIQICEQGGKESAGNAGQQGERYPQQERRERRSKPTFVKLLRPLPVKPVCTSNQLKVKTRQTIHISKQLMPEVQNFPYLAAPQRECEQQGEEEDDGTFSTSAQDLCPVCQLPLPNSQQQQNCTSSFRQSSWSEPEQLESSGTVHLSSSCPHCERYELRPCYHHLPPFSSSTAASSQQVICPDCWPLVRLYFSCCCFL